MSDHDPFPLASMMDALGDDAKQRQLLDRAHGLVAKSAPPKKEHDKKPLEKLQEKKAEQEPEEQSGRKGLDNESFNPPQEQELIESLDRLDTLFPAAAKARPAHIAELKTLASPLAGGFVTRQPSLRSKLSRL